MTARPARSERKAPNWLIGLVLIIVVAMGLLYAFTKKLPWSDAYEVRAVFSSAQSIRVDSPVRIAGVNVGTVSKVEHLTSAESEAQTAQVGAPASTPEDAAPGEQAAIVTMELTEDALPLHSDSTFKIRPRLFLEGNYFVDVAPGSPNADEVDENHTFPVNQTAGTVQLDQVLGALQGDVRVNLQVFLDQFGNALVKEGGAEGFQELYRSSAPSFKFTSQVNEAFLGTEPGDLRGVIKGLDRVVRGLGRNEAALQSLVTNFRVFSGSFAAEDVALGRAIEELPNTLEASRPAFANLNTSFPALRAFAREALPGVQSTPATLDAAIPFISQVRQLVSERELRGLVADLRPTIPDLARLTKENIPFMSQVRSLSSCFNEVVIPWSNDTVEPVGDAYPHPPSGRVYEETGYGLSGIASESRSGDANGQYIRVGGGGGLNTVQVPNAIPTADGGGLQDAVGLAPFDILGAMPKLTDSLKTPFKPNTPCETQEPPNLEGGLGDVPFDESTADAPAMSPTDVLAASTPEAIRAAAERLGLPAEQSDVLEALGGGG